MATVQVFIEQFLDGKGKFFVRGIYCHKKNRQYMVCGFAQKDGRGLNFMFDTKLPDFGCQKPSVYVHVPLRFMKTAVAAVAHVLSGHNPEEMVFPEELEDKERELAVDIAEKFQRFWQGPLRTAHIYPKKRLVREKPVDLGALKVNRPSCVF